MFKTGGGADKASVMIIAVWPTRSQARLWRFRMRLLDPQNGHKGLALLVLLSLDS